MSMYNPNKFIQAITNKIGSSGLPKCPYCGGKKYTTTENIAVILISDNTTNVNLGPHIPSGMMVCENCGHIEFFALGALGLLTGEDVSK